jgi:hypothetical protein
VIHINTALSKFQRYFRSCIETASDQFFLPRAKKGSPAEAGRIEQKRPDQLSKRGNDQHQMICEDSFIETLIYLARGVKPSMGRPLNLLGVFRPGGGWRVPMHPSSQVHKVLEIVNVLQIIGLEVWGFVAEAKKKHNFAYLSGHFLAMSIISSNIKDWYQMSWMLLDSPSILIVWLCTKSPCKSTWLSDTQQCNQPHDLPFLL